MRPLIYSTPMGVVLRRPSLFRRAMGAIVAVLRLIIPVACLAVVALTADLTTNRGVSWFDGAFPWIDPAFLPSHWLTVGHLVFPAVFFLLCLISRRYGQTSAAAALWVAAVLAGVSAYLFAQDHGQSVSELTGLPSRTVAAFGVAAIMAGLANIRVYEIKRGFPWWRAPFLASLASAVVFCALFFPIAFWGQNNAWTNYMLVYLALLSAASFAGLFPYYLLKALIRPLRGLGYAPD